ncbi:hypothetical protein, partial [Mesorhizobium sp. M4B.F.Ca.ET.089.01.1.1]|uniref:hypothetical protein n=1 Tax=Mesorhizobium sp. M4B.F.Ca.ET.089.01.1.1 TaxID=2496662 RepID=UPI001AED1004
NIFPVQLFDIRQRLPQPQIGVIRKAGLKLFLEAVLSRAISLKRNGAYDCAEAGQALPLQRCLSVLVPLRLSWVRFTSPPGLSP